MIKYEKEEPQQKHPCLLLYSTKFPLLGMIKYLPNSIEVAFPLGSDLREKVLLFITEPFLRNRKGKNQISNKRAKAERSTRESPNCERFGRFFYWSMDWMWVLHVLGLSDSSRLLCHAISTLTHSNSAARAVCVFISAAIVWIKIIF